MSLNEFIVENAALTWFGELGSAVKHGPKMAANDSAKQVMGDDKLKVIVCWKGIGRLRMSSMARKLWPASDQSAASV